ncbi:MAG: hypothetical protein P1V97_03965 [Planctomycetota bacterium]|nr:hypothetical protein [Planctomycetota bacterium]
MGESIHLAPGTLWKNQWTGVTVKVTSISDGTVSAENTESGETLKFPSTDAFMKNHVSA